MSGVISVLASLKSSAGGGSDIVSNQSAYWVCNGSGATITDSINGHDFTNFSGTQSGGLLDVNGASGEDATLADHADFAPGTAFTVFGWEKYGAAAGSVWFANWEFGTADRAWLVGSDGSTGTKLRVAITESGTFASGNRKDYEGSSTTMGDNNWHSWAFTWSSGTLKLYVDGVRETETPVLDDSFTTMYNGIGPLCIGGITSSGSVTNAYVGQLQRIRMYQRALSATDIAALHAVGHA